MKLFIAGAGTMGAGIAQAFAEKGTEVWLYDTVEAAVESGLTKLKRGLEASGQAACASLVHPATTLEAAAEADLIIEAIFENREVKQALFQELDGLCKPDAIFASNTMSLSITELAAGLIHDHRMVGIHFFNPAPKTPLVEVVYSLVTDPAVVEQVKLWMADLGKTPITTPDYAGFIVNRLVMPQINDAAYLVMEAGLDPEQIDQALILSMNHIEGPLHHADRIGNDTVLQILENLYEDTGDARYRPCPLLIRMVQAGLLGCKTGRGFFRYEPS